ncbi:Acidic leucine-rich nuclear phosphoprotein 32-related protein [Apostasia shenzhenica]|uniref:Acidic leucine-rich nuclear phosphoprotein 32-related protein n=1 Tax=Apostasia shenzhenica TaxID=1088818 RepID=A0A2I0A2E3_9ASPA|nr:Acidic leucine-rich nuclear phosphoprotein 32-related protein [Apostasia shenzhenica]
MDEAWERAVEAALEGQTTPSSELRSLNLDGAVKCLHGCLPPAVLLERFPGLEHLSIANVGAPSLEKFPRLRNLQRLILSDNRIAGGLENLVEAGLQSLRDLDLSNNRIQYIEDLAPLAKLHLVSLDLYECPVTRISDYRFKVFSMIRTLKYLDKLDDHGNERPETDDDEDDEEEEEDYEEDEEDPGSGEVDGDDRTGKLASVGAVAAGDEGIVDVDEDEGSDADEEEMETNGRVEANVSARGSGGHISNGFRVAASGAAYFEVDEEDLEDEEEDDDDLGEEIDEEGEDDDDDDDVVEVHDVLGSDDEEEDGVDDADDDEDDVDEEEEDEDSDEEDEDDDREDEVGVEEDEEDEMGVEDEEGAELGNPGRLTRTEGEIDGHDHGEEDENGEVGEEENGEIGEEDEQGVGHVREGLEDDGEGEDEDDLVGEYLVQPIVRPNGSSIQSHFNVDNEDEVDQEEETQKKSSPVQHATPSSNAHKRRRDEEGDLDDETNVEQSRLPKRH